MCHEDMDAQFTICFNKGEKRGSRKLQMSQLTSVPRKLLEQISKAPKW